MALIAKFQGCPLLAHNPKSTLENKAQKKGNYRDSGSTVWNKHGEPRYSHQRHRDEVCQQANGLQIVKEVQKGRGPSRSHSSSRAMHYIPAKLVFD
jgi:hypothetical protein